MNRSIPPKTEIWSLVFALVLVLFIAISAYRAWAAYGRQSEQLAITRSIVDGTNSLLSSLKDAETGQRGYLLTGEDRYLEPYLHALVEVPVVLDTLAKATALRPDQERRVATLRPMVSDKIAELKQTIELRQSNGPEAPLEVVRSDRGKQAMDRIRQECATIQAVAYSQLARYGEESRSSANQIGLISTLGSIGLFTLLAYSTLTIHRATRRRQQLIRDLQKSEVQIAEARDWLQTTLGSIGDGVIATDAEGRVAFLNRVAESLTGFARDQAVGMSLEQVFVIHNEDTGAAVENPVNKVLREDRVVGLANHTRLTSQDGRQIPIDDSAAPIRDREGRIIGVVLVFRDMTEKRLAELAERQATVALAHHAKLLERTNGELRQFAYAASHDLREPLRTISVYSELLKSENAVHLNYRNDKAAEYLQFISASARRMSQLVDSLLEYSCVADAAGESPVPVPFHQTLQTTLANLSGSIADNEAVITYDRLPNIMGKEIHFAQLLQNLIGNALKYRGPESPRIHVAAKEDENAWVFSVSDNGQGIAPAYREQIFELFARLHGHEYPGAGIGLATCKKVVERYGGRIWVESEVGRGSTFFFTLPAATEFQKPS